MCTMDMKGLRILLVGHLSVHLDPMERGLRRHCEVETLSWKQVPLFTRGSSLVIVPLLVLRILFQSMLKRTDVILAQYAFPDGFSSTLASRLLKVPSVMQVIGSDILIAAKGVKRRLISWAVSRASGVICVSQELEASVRNMGAENTIVIPSPLDLVDLPQRADVKKIDRRLITVAMLTKVKGLDILLKALENIVDVEVLIVGGGPEEANLRRMAENSGLKDKVRFVGIVPHKEVWSHLLSSSIFVLPSLSEGVPRALLEAMACGLFIIATNVGGIPDVVKDGWNGILVEPNNPSVLREAIDTALSDARFVNAVGERNKSEARKYDLETLAEKQFQFLKSIRTRDDIATSGCDEGTHREKLERHCPNASEHSSP